MTLSQLKQLTESRLNWTALLTSVIDRLNLSSSITITDDELVIVYDIPYYKQMTKILIETPRHLIQNYMGFMFVSSNVGHAGKALRHLALEYEKATLGLKSDADLWKRCRALVSKKWSFTVSRLYVQRYAKPGAKTSADKLINNIKVSITFHSIFTNQHTNL